MASSRCMIFSISKSLRSVGSSSSSKRSGMRSERYLNKSGGKYAEFVAIP